MSEENENKEREAAIGCAIICAVLFAIAMGIALMISHDNISKPEKSRAYKNLEEICDEDYIKGFQNHADCMNRELPREARRQCRGKSGDEFAICWSEERDKLLEQAEAHY